MIRKIFERGIWLTAGSIIGRSGPVIGGGLLVRAIGLESFAPIAALLAFLIVFPALTTQSIGLVMTQGLATIDSARERVAFLNRGYALALGYAVIGILILMALAKLNLLNKIPGLSSPYLTYISLAGGFFMAGILLSQAILNGLGRVRSVAASTALTGLLQGAMMLHGVISGDAQLVGISIVILLGAAFLLNTIFIWYALHTMKMQFVDPDTQKLQLRQHDYLSSSWVVLLKRSGWTLLASLFVVPVTYVCADFLHALPDGEEQYAAFVVLEQIVGVIGYLPGLLAQASLPVLSQELAKDTRTGTLLFLRQILPLKFILAVIIAISGLVLAPTLPHIFGNQIRKYIIATQWAIAYTALMIPLVSVGTAVQARGRFIEGALFNAIWAVVFLMMSYYWGRYKGLEGIQISRVIATCALLLALLLFFSKMAKHDENLED